MCFYILSLVWDVCWCWIWWHSLRVSLHPVPPGQSVEVSPETGHVPHHGHQHGDVSVPGTEQSTTWQKVVCLFKGANFPHPSSFILHFAAFKLFSFLLLFCRNSNLRSTPVSLSVCNQMLKTSIFSYIILSQISLASYLCSHLWIAIQS